LHLNLTSNDASVTAFSVYSSAARSPATNLTGDWAAASPPTNFFVFDFCRLSRDSFLLYSEYFL